MKVIVSGDPYLYIDRGHMKTILAIVNLEGHF